MVLPRPADRVGRSLCNRSRARVRRPGSRAQGGQARARGRDEGTGRRGVDRRGVGFGGGRRAACPPGIPPLDRGALRRPVPRPRRRLRPLPTPRALPPVRSALGRPGQVGRGPAQRGAGARGLGGARGRGDAGVRGVAREGGRVGGYREGVQVRVQGAVRRAGVGRCVVVGGRGGLRGMRGGGVGRGLRTRGRVGFGQDGGRIWCNWHPRRLRRSGGTLLALAFHLPPVGPR
ncbi:hypothetical protein DFJ74DRAFT_657528 [Hyaloraphidium curvatum]|nr:hypothetical protein DFJ74DRAFT_657528 [Hyaloraphidium curvatum]